MTPDQVKQHRYTLGMTQAELAEALRMSKGGDRQIRRWESGQVYISGPASVALELLVEKKGRL